ncbi:unnamed protein product [Musa textilis]
MLAGFLMQQVPSSIQYMGMENYLKPSVVVQLLKVLFMSVLSSSSCISSTRFFQVLRMPLSALPVDKETGKCKGVRLASGQDMLSRQVIRDPSFEVPSFVSPLNVVCERLKTSNFSGNVAKGVRITSSSILPDLSSVLVIFPPKV